MAELKEGWLNVLRKSGIYPTTPSGFIRCEPILDKEKNVRQFLISDHCNSEPSQIIACMIYASKMKQEGLKHPLQLNFSAIIEKSKECSINARAVLNRTNLENHVRDIANETGLVEIELVFDVSNIETDENTDSDTSIVDLSILELQGDIESIEERSCIFVRNNEFHWVAISRIENRIWMFKPARLSRNSKDTLLRECSCLMEGFNPSLLKTDDVFTITRLL